CAIRQVRLQDARFSTFRRYGGGKRVRVFARPAAMDGDGKPMRGKIQRDGPSYSLCPTGDQGSLGIWPHQLPLRLSPYIRRMYWIHSGSLTLWLKPILNER